MIRHSGSIELSRPPGCSCLIGTKENIQKIIKYRLCRKKCVSARRLSIEFHISQTSVQWIMKNDLGRRVYKKVIEPLFSSDQNIERKNICKLALNKFSKRGDDENSLFRWDSFWHWCSREFWKRSSVSRRLCWRK